MIGILSFGRVPSSCRPFLFISLTALLCLPASATDLLEAYLLAQASDPTFEAARHALEGVRQKIPQAKAALLPVVNITGQIESTPINIGLP